jgi:hypothetical protein
VAERKRGAGARAQVEALVVAIVGGGGAIAIVGARATRRAGRPPGPCLFSPPSHMLTVLFNTTPALPHKH